MFRRFGATAMTINFSEVYNALKTKFVDGQENPLSLIEANKFYEVQKYVSVTNHMWDGFWLTCPWRAPQLAVGIIADDLADVVDAGQTVAAKPQAMSQK